MTVTIRDIAAATGVSAATVSRALSSPTKVSASTRELVAAAAERLGYHAPVTKAERNRVSTRTIGVLVPELDAVSTMILKAVQDELVPRGIDVVIVDTERDPGGEIASAHEIRHIVDGVLLVDPGASDAEIQFLNHHIPVAVSLRVVEGVASTTIDERPGIAALAQHLWSLGHRDVALVDAPSLQPSGSVQAQLAEAGFVTHPVGRFPATFEGGAAAVDAVLASRATAVVATTDEVAIGLMGALASRDVHVPDRVSVASLQDSPMAETVSPTLTAISVDHPALTHRINALLSRLVAGREGSEAESIATRLSARASTSVAPYLPES